MEIDKASRKRSSEHLKANWRFRKPEVGIKGWLHRSHNYTPARTPFTILALSEGTLSAIIQLGRGREKRVFTSVLDCGREYRTRRGEWIPESDPRVRKWLVRAVTDIRAGGKRVCDSDDLLVRSDALRDLEWVMLRNGWLQS